MRKDGVPQDATPTYGGGRKLLYAVDERGNYGGVQSTGWEAEGDATLAAIAEIDRLRRDAWQRARSGLASPLEYHMYRQRMDLALLAQTTGLWRWRIRRHFRPRSFVKLSPGILLRYGNALGLPIEELRRLPENLDTTPP